MFAGVTAGGPASTNWYVAVRNSHEIRSVDELREGLVDWPAPVPSVLARTESSAVLRHEISDLPPLRSYVRGRVALVGDAAHAMTPSLGQGACQAMLDSLSLARHMHTAEGVDAALHRYDDERRATASRFVRGSRVLSRVQFAGPGLETPRNVVIRATSRFMR